MNHHAQPSEASAALTCQLSLQSAQNGGVITWSGIELQGILSGSTAMPGNVGEGAISILFTGDHVEIGLDILKANGGTATLQFFERSGAVFDTTSFSVNGNQPYTFRASDGVSRFAGVTITNVDSSGIAIDNLRLDTSVVPIPEPSTFAIWSLLGLSCIGIGWWRKRKAA